MGENGISVDDLRRLAGTRIPWRTISVCVLVAFLSVAGEPDIIDSVKTRILIDNLPAPGFCEVMALPVDGVILGGTQ